MIAKSATQILWALERLESARDLDITIQETVPISEMKQIFNKINEIA
jgi:hypothetical protein